jgi:hypothetical protein
LQRGRPEGTRATKSPHVTRDRKHEAASGRARPAQRTKQQRGRGRRFARPWQVKGGCCAVVGGGDIVHISPDSQGVKHVVGRGYTM